MSILTSLYLLAHESKEFGLNTNIFETNLVNIILLIVLLVNVLGNFLKTSLSARQKKIIESVEESEKKLNDANQRLDEANLQWQQASISLKQLQKAAEIKKANIFENQYKKGQEDLEERFDGSLSLLRFREKQIFDSLVRDTTILTFYQVKEKLKQKLGKEEQSLLIDKKINLLGES